MLPEENGVLNTSGDRNLPDKGLIGLEWI